MWYWVVGSVQDLIRPGFESQFFHSLKKLLKAPDFPSYDILLSVLTQCTVKSTKVKLTPSATTYSFNRGTEEM